MELNFNKILKEGCKISSSGTTGDPKQIFRTPDNLKACNEVAIDCQKITKNSSIYTCTRMTHAGGLLLQSLPAYTLGCDITIEKFNAFSFLKRFKGHTHTFLSPAMCEAVMNTKGFIQADFTGKIIAMGSDPIPWNHIYEFVSKGATVIANWGMSEIGPCTINTTFTNKDQIDRYFEYAPKDTTILGDTFYCDAKVENNKLFVKGPTCIYEDWFETGDLVEQKFMRPQLRWNPLLYYQGRKTS